MSVKTFDELATFLLENIINASLIPASKLAEYLQDMNDTLEYNVGEFSDSFMGKATTSTNPGTPTSRVWYICDGPGTYTNFGSTVVTELLAFLIYNGSSWDLVENEITVDLSDYETTAELDTRFSNHNASSGHDGRYFTETEVNNTFCKKTMDADLNANSNKIINIGFPSAQTDVIPLKIAEATAKQLLKVHNSSLIFQAFVTSSTATPSHTANYAWVSSETGTVFGIATVEKGDIIYSTGSEFVVEKIGAIKVNRTNNLFDKDGFLNLNSNLGSTGTLITLSGAITTDYIKLPVETEGTEYYIQGVGSGTSKRTSFYNSEKVHISTTSALYGPGIRTVPAGGASYVRITIYRPTETFNIDEVMFSLGNAAADYLPYYLMSGQLLLSDVTAITDPIEENIDSLKIASCFRDANLGETETEKMLTLHKAIKHVQLLGNWIEGYNFRISSFSNNYSTLKYELKITAIDDDGVVYSSLNPYYNSTTAFDITPEVSGLTKVVYPVNNGRQLIMYIDFSELAATTRYNDATNFVFKSEYLPTYKIYTNSPVFKNLFSFGYHKTEPADSPALYDAIKGIKLRGLWDKSKRYTIAGFAYNHATLGYLIRINEVNTSNTIVSNIYWTDSVLVTLGGVPPYDNFVYHRIVFPVINGKQAIIDINLHQLTTGTYYDLESGTSYFINNSQIEDEIRLESFTLPDYTGIDFAPINQYIQNRKKKSLKGVSTSKKGALSIRIDNALDVGSIGYLSRLAALYEKYNGKISLNDSIETYGIVTTQKNKIQEYQQLQRGGHAVGDHVPSHNCDFIKIPTGYEYIFTPYVGAGITEIITGGDYDVAILEREHDGAYTDYKIGATDGYSLVSGTNRINGDFSGLSSENYYIYVNNVTGDKIGWQAIDTLNSAYVLIKTVDGRAISFDANETLSMYAQPVGMTVILSEEATYLCFLSGLCWFHYCGLEKPDFWVQPGAACARVSNEYAESAMKRVGYLFADTYDNVVTKLTYNEEKAYKYSGHTYNTADFAIDTIISSGGDFSSAKIKIADRIALHQHITIASHFYIDSCPGATDWEKVQYYFEKLEPFLRWTFENKLLWLTYPEIVDMMIDCKTDPFVNIIPDLYTDIASQSKPDGYTLGGSTVWMTDDGVAEDKLHSLKLNGNGTIATITDLGGLEKGLNDFNIWIKGTPGATVAVQFGSIGTATFTVAGSGWNRLNITAASGLSELIIPYDTNFLTITITAGNNTGNDAFVSGMELRKK